ncbi:hypothetical protein [Haloarcula litorea]|uniref:hypothetical protein n=1 Tax=Haloarcula litorea TaxID=3032579 RepID=UPI0023E895F3|nr:hypothetical protein [Halomicroarcula sp. GDY20]
MADDVFREAGLESIGVWELDAELGDDLDMEWSYGDHTVTVSPADETSPATAQVIYSKPAEDITVWETQGEWTAVLQETMEWLERRESGPAVESEEYATDIGAWEHDVGTYTRVDGGHRPVLHWVDDGGTETRAAIRPEDGQYIFKLVDRDDVYAGEPNQGVVITSGEFWGTLEHAVGWMEDNEEGVDLKTRRVELGRRERANDWRDKIPNYALTSDDDRREKTIEFYPQLVDDVQVERMEMIEAESDDYEPLMKTKLADHEVERIRNKAGYNAPQDRFKAMWVKSLAMRKGVRDWTGYFDPELTVDEHRQTLSTAGVWGDLETLGEGTGPGHDVVDESRVQEACFKGDINACEALLDHTDVTERELVSRAYDNDAVDVLEDVIDDERLDELLDSVKEEKIGVLYDVDEELARTLERIDEGDHLRVGEVEGEVVSITEAETEITIADFGTDDKQSVYFVEQAIDDGDHDYARWSVSVEEDEDPIFIEHLSSSRDDQIISWGVSDADFRTDNVEVLTNE